MKIIRTKKEALSLYNKKGSALRPHSYDISMCSSDLFMCRIEQKKELAIGFLMTSSKDNKNTFTLAHVDIYCNRGVI